MSKEEIKVLFEQLENSQNKYTYFILAFSASAIALVMKQTSTAVFSYSLIPLGVAIFFWGASFFAGCKNIHYKNSHIYANIEYLRIIQGTHPQVGNDQQYISIAAEGINRAMNTNSKRANTFSIWQFRLAVYGGLSYIVWHLTEMTIRSFNIN